MQQGFLVEQFGAVRGHQSFALNYHLNATVTRFDQAYGNSIGPLGSQEHLNSRDQYAAFVANQLLDLYANETGIPTKIRTETHTELQNGTIDVRSASTFKNAL